MNRVYQGCYSGYNGSTDETDDQVKWIAAPSMYEARLVCERLGWPIADLMEINVPPFKADGCDAIFQEVFPDGPSL